MGDSWIAQDRQLSCFHSLSLFLPPSLPLSLSGRGLRSLSVSPSA